MVDALVPGCCKNTNTNTLQLLDIDVPLWSITIKCIFLSLSMNPGAHASHSGEGSRTQHEKPWAEMELDSGRGRMCRVTQVSSEQYIRNVYMLMTLNTRFSLVLQLHSSPPPPISTHTTTHRHTPHTLPHPYYKHAHLHYTPMAITIHTLPYHTHTHPPTPTHTPSLTTHIPSLITHILPHHTPHTHYPTQHEVQAGIACVFYIEQLVRHAQPELKEKRPKKKLLENLQPLSKVLSDLEVDLRTNPNDS